MSVAVRRFIRVMYGVSSMRLAVAAVWALSGLVGSSVVAQPEQVPSMPPEPAAAQPSASEPAETEQADNTPSVEEISAMVVEAVGGREKVDAINSLRVVFESGQSSFKTKIDAAWSRGGGRHMLIDLGSSSAEMGSDGKQAWVKSGDQYSLAVGDQSQRLEVLSEAHMGMIDPLMNRDENLSVLQFKERATFNGSECYRLYFERKGGMTTGYYYVDTATHLPAGYEQEDRDAGGMSMRSITSLSDWREVDGVRLFHEMKAWLPGKEQLASVTKVTSVEINSLDEARFTLPDEVIGLVENEAERVKQLEADLATPLQLSDLPADHQSRATGIIGDLRALGDANLDDAVMSIEHSYARLPDEPSRKMMLYVLQELKREQASRKQK